MGCDYQANSRATPRCLQVVRAHFGQQFRGAATSLRPARFGCVFGNCPHVDGISSTCRTTSLSSLIYPSTSCSFRLQPSDVERSYLFARGFCFNRFSASGVSRKLSLLEKRHSFTFHITRKRSRVQGQCDSHSSPNSDSLSTNHCGYRYD